MYGLLSAFRKEFLILIRDIPGLAILFIMPVLLIMIVTLAQQNALKSSKESRTDVLFIDHAHSAFSRLCSKNLDSSGLYRLVSSQAGVLLDDETARKKIGEGDYPVGIVVMSKDTAIRLLVDPSLQSSYKNSINRGIDLFYQRHQSRVAIENLLKTLAPAMASGIDGLIETNMKNMPPVTRDLCNERNMLRSSLPSFRTMSRDLFSSLCSLSLIPLSGSMVTEKK